MGNGHHVAAQGGALIWFLRCPLDTLMTAERLGKRTAPRALNTRQSVRWDAQFAKATKLVRDRSHRCGGLAPSCCFWYFSSSG